MRSRPREAARKVNHIKAAEVDGVELGGAVDHRQAGR